MSIDKCLSELKQMTHRMEGFSLVEIILSVSLLAILMVFTVPKVIEAQDSSSKKATFRELFSVLYTIQDEGIAYGKLHPGSYKDYIFSRLNAARFCNGNSSAEGCWNTAVQGSIGIIGTEAGEAGFVMQNGATVVGFSNCCANGPVSDGLWTADWLIDWNGRQGPNIIGEDQLLVLHCYGKQDCGAWVPDQPPGSFRPWSTQATLVGNGWDTANTDLYHWIFEEKY
jgi:hypothetical protein